MDRLDLNGPAAPAARAIVFAARPGDRARSGRTMRAIRLRGLEPIDATNLPAAEIASLVAAGPVWLVRAGAFLGPSAEGAPAPFPFPPPSATGRPLCALGAVRALSDEPSGEDAQRWAKLLKHTGGDLSGAARGVDPPIASVYLAAEAATRLADHLAHGAALPQAIAATVADPSLRHVHIPALDVHDDARLRVLLAVTSLQQGGAERVVLDLFHTLGDAGICARIAVLGRPSRAAFPTPAGTIDASRSPDRVAAVASAAVAYGADLLHGHLLVEADIDRLARAGVPIALTIHNTRPGWPVGLDRLGAGHASLLIACSLAVEADLRDGRLPIAQRTIWNGIDLDRLAPSSATRAAGAKLRRSLGIGSKDLVLLAIANPRPQKRLHLLPPVLAAARAEIRRRGLDREARIVLVGDDAPRAETARGALDALRREIDRLDLGRFVHLTGSMDNIVPALAAADALVSVSAHEGLSLAHLEALGAGLPVIALDAGGTRELADDNPAVLVLPGDAPPVEVAIACVDRAISPPQGGAAAAKASFSRARMASRHASIYRRVVAASGRRDRRGVVLVTNNFSTGGAQSSARRLLAGLAAAGDRVRAVVIQEQPAYPTPGRRALEAQGIPVLALPEAGTIDAAPAIDLLLDHLDADPPAAVILWNALAEHKILIADALLDIPVFDVSPGEMYFASLDRYFQRPRPGLPYRDARAYGSRLAGVVVKYAAEADRAREALGAKVHVIPNGVDLGPPPTPRVRSRGDRLVIGTVARISPQKRLEDLIAAIRIAQPDLGPHVLRVAGGPERGSEAYAEDLRRLAAGLDVEWLGDIDGAGSLLRELDVFAMISEPAGCPNASLEAMAAGLPVIATDVGGASEQVEDGVTGRLVPRRDPHAFAAALIELARDPDRRHALGAAGRARAEARFDVKRMIANYRSLCLGENHRIP